MSSHRVKGESRSKEYGAKFAKDELKISSGSNNSSKNKPIFFSINTSLSTPKYPEVKYVGKLGSWTQFQGGSRGGRVGHNTIQFLDISKLVYNLTQF